MQCTILDLLCPSRPKNPAGNFFKNIFFISFLPARKKPSAFHSQHKQQISQQYTTTAKKNVTNECISLCSYSYHLWPTCTSELRFHLQKNREDQTQSHVKGWGGGAGSLLFDNSIKTHTFLLNTTSCAHMY